VRTSLRQVKLRVHRLQPDGRLDRAFGRAGIATVALAGPQPPTPPPIDVRRGLQVLDRGRGRVLVVAAVPAAVAYMPPALEPIALTGAGALDPLLRYAGRCDGACEPDLRDAGERRDRAGREHPPSPGRPPHRRGGQRAARPQRRAALVGRPARARPPA
jgi:hypothetical protein